MSSLLGTSRTRTAGRDMRRRLVVIGNGMAGARAVEEILARGGADQFAITMFGDELYGNYNRMMLAHLLCGKEQESSIIVNPVSWYRDNGITLHTGVTAERINRSTRHVFSSDGRVTPYDVLIIATGSRPYLPPLDGLHTPGGSLKQGVFRFRTMDDIRKILAYLRQDRPRAVVVGGGQAGMHVGIHAAHGLRSRGLRVETVPLGATAVLGRDRAAGVSIRGGSDLACDLVVVAAGVRPNTDLAVLSGLPVERAIVVDDSMRVQDEDAIYALGECVQHRGEVYGMVAPAWEQAAVVAAHVTGTDTSAAYLGTRGNPGPRGLGGERKPVPALGRV